MYKILTQYSLWYLIFCVLAGIGYAYLLYQKKSPWSKKINFILAGLRFTLVTILAFLLLGPLIKYFINYTEKPIVVFAIDDSQSILLNESKANLDVFISTIQGLTKKLADSDIDVSIHSFSNSKTADSIQFKHPTTNLSSLLNTIESTYENRNLISSVLFSDGIYNQGSDPNYSLYSFPIYTLGLGDTIPKKDISIKNLTYNKVSYKNNSFPIVSEIHATGFQNKSTEVLLKQGAKIIESKTISFLSENAINKVEFYTSSSLTGIQHYTIELKKVDGELTLQNNKAHAYIDIIENKEKILIIAASPHPDIKAIRAAIEKKENYEFILYIPGIHEFKEDKYDLVIAHQLPDYIGSAKNILEKIKTDNASILYIIGNQTNLNQLNNSNSILSIATRQGQKDLVTPEFNPTFNRFSTAADEKNIIHHYPPLIVPYGEYTLKGNADVIVYQKIGNTNSSRPLLVTSNDRKLGIIAGEGLWLWRQQEYLETQDTKAFDTFIANVIQYMSLKEDKRKFRVFPIADEFMTTEPVYLETEIYNDVFEKIYNQKIELKITNEEGKLVEYSFENGENNSRFEIKGLPQGVYKYSASAVLGNRTEKYEGRFTIKELQLETLQSTADHNLLRQLSSKNNGNFYTVANATKIAEDILAKNPKNILHTNEELVDLISMPWLFFLLLSLISVEWFMRKYNGGY